MSWDAGRRGIRAGSESHRELTKPKSAPRRFRNSAGGWIQAGSICVHEGDPVGAVLRKVNPVGSGIRYSREFVGEATSRTYRRVEVHVADVVRFSCEWLDDVLRQEPRTLGLEGTVAAGPWLATQAEGGQPNDMRALAGEESRCRIVLRSKPAVVVGMANGQGRIPGVELSVQEVEACAVNDDEVGVEFDDRT
jgi:hypothetical protein